MEFAVQVAKLNVAEQGIGGETKAGQECEEDQAVPKLEAPANGLEDHRRLPAIAVTAAGGDELRAELFADVGNLDVEQIGKGAFVFVEEMLVEGGAGDDFALV